MSVNKKDFYGKEVPEAIKKACEAFKVPQEQLIIEVVETGSTGIFGLIRKNAHIRAQVRPVIEEEIEEIFNVETLKSRTPLSGDVSRAEKEQERPASVEAPAVQSLEKPVQESRGDADGESAEETADEPSTQAAEVGAEEKGQAKTEAASEESLAFLKNELTSIVELMGFPSTVSVEAKGLTVHCLLSGEFEEELTGPEGKTLDSLQYLMRKIITKKVPERLKLTVDVGDFREKRQEELKVRALELAAMVKEDGKTQVIPALNPSERRVIHMALQEDKDIRSRSVGDGLFKKILIFKPGKTHKTGRKRPQARGRKGKNPQAKKPSEDA